MVCFLEFIILDIICIYTAQTRRDMGLELFRSQLLLESSLCDKIIEGAIDMITTER
jgi:hypothetical protein